MLCDLAVLSHMMQISYDANFIKDNSYTTFTTIMQPCVSAL